MNAKIKKTVKVIQETYVDTDETWVIGYSGGKDSSALLKLVFLALSTTIVKNKEINIIYCDTGVEIPVISNFVKATLNGIKKEGEHEGIPINICISEPKLEDRFFVKVIGRGYPSPTNKFRWCTDKLRIDPVQNVIKNITDKKALILLGIRNGESNERDRTLDSFRINGSFFLKQSGNANTRIFAPLLNYNLQDIWRALEVLEKPVSIDFNKLFKLYQNTTGECPLIRSSNDIPCGNGRFGCWTCTVVRHDRAVENLIKSGERDLIPLFGFRNWLAKIRDDSKYRCRKRRNNSSGPGPFTLEAREKIFECLLMTQKQTQWELITSDEIKMIKKLWNQDYNNPKYLEIE